MPFLTFFSGSFAVQNGDHLRSGIICGTLWGSFAVLVSFAVQFGDHLRFWDHLRSWDHLRTRTVRFKITSCACAIVEAFKRECRRAPAHDFLWLAFTSSSEKRFEEVSIYVKICFFASVTAPVTFYSSSFHN